MNATLMTIGISATVLVAAILLLRLSASGFAGYHRNFTQRSEGALREAFLFVDPERIFRYLLAGALVLPAALWYLSGSFVPALLGLGVIFVLPRLSYAVMARRRKALILVQLPDAMLMLSSAMRAGTSLQTALDIVVKETPAPLAQELGVVAREQRLGVALEDALDSMATRLKLEDLDLIVAAMTIAKQVGGNLAETLDRLAGTLRAKQAMEGKIRALTSQGKLQGLVVGALPIVLVVAFWMMDPVSMMPMFTKWWGWCVVALIVLLEAAGGFMIKKIVSIDI